MSGQSIQGGEPFRGGGGEVRARGGASLVGDDAGVAAVVEPGERKRWVDEVGRERFPGGAVACRDALSLAGGEARMAKAVEDVEGGLADSAAGEEVLEQMVAEREHELGGIERRDRFKVTVGRPDPAAGESVDVRMEIAVVAVALNRDAER